MSVIYELLAAPQGQIDIFTIGPTMWLDFDIPGGSLLASPIAQVEVQAQGVIRNSSLGVVTATLLVLVEQDGEIIKQWPFVFPVSPVPVDYRGDFSFTARIFAETATGRLVHHIIFGVGSSGMNSVESFSSSDVIVPMKGLWSKALANDAGKVIDLMRDIEVCLGLGLSSEAPSHIRCSIANRTAILRT